MVKSQVLPNLIRNITMRSSRNSLYYIGFLVMVISHIARCQTEEPVTELPTAPPDTPVPDTSALETSETTFIPETTHIRTHAPTYPVSTYLKSLPDTFSTLISLINTAELMDYLDNLPGVTLLAPSNEAFKTLAPEFLPSLTSNSTQLRNFLLYHVIPQKNLHWKDEGIVETAQGHVVRLNDNNDHGVRSINGAALTADHGISNGHVYTLDNVVLPPTGSLYDILSTRPDLTTFASLVEKFSLKTLLQGGNHSTVFAPNNAAFAALGEGNLNKLASNPDTGLLQDLVLYHIITAHTFYSKQVYHLEELNGSDRHRERIVIIKHNGVVLVNTAQIVVPDIPATNGVLLVLDKVLLSTRLEAVLEGSGIVG